MPAQLSHFETYNPQNGGRTMFAGGLQGVEDGQYVYGVTNLDSNDGNAPTLLVRVSRSFDGWEVTRTQ